MQGAKITLAALRDEDLPVLHGWINHREQILSSSPYKPIGQAHHRQWFDTIQRREDVVIFGIRVVETDTLIGTCQLHSISSVHRSAELQIRVGDVRSRGTGYGSEAVALLLKFAFRDLNLNRVYLHVFESNVAAIGLYHKAGFVQEGKLRQAAFIDGQYIDVLVMSILLGDYSGQ